MPTLKTFLMLAALAAVIGALTVRGCAIESEWQEERDARQECLFTECD
jgi:hypothetical protein